MDITRLLAPMLLAGATALAACSPSAAAPPSSTPSEIDATVDWEDPSKVVRFDGGWAIGACEGDAPFLCVEKHGATVGVVEAAFYPVASFTELDPDAADEDNLRALAAGFVAALGADRAAGCGAEYGFEPIDPGPFPLGGGEGLAYGFTGTRADGQPSELNLQYSAITGTQIVSIVAIAYDEGGCPGRDDLSSFDSVTLVEFRPMLEEVLAASPLPAAPPAPTPTPAPPATVAPTTTDPPPTTTTVPPTTAPATTQPAADPVADGSGCTPGPGDLGDGRWYGLLAANDGTALTFDLACWFTGEDAVRAAAQDGAEPPPNDYYVRNQNSALRTLQATAHTEVVWYPQLGDPGSETTITFAEWDAAKDQRELMPGIWVVIEDGVVTRIQEQWVP